MIAGFEIFDNDPIHDAATWGNTSGIDLNFSIPPTPATNQGFAAASAPPAISTTATLAPPDNASQSGQDDVVMDEGPLAAAPAQQSGGSGDDIDDMFRQFTNVSPPGPVAQAQQTQDDPPSLFFPGWDVFAPPAPAGDGQTVDPGVADLTNRFRQYNIAGAGVVFNIHTGPPDRPPSPQPYNPVQQRPLYPYIPAHAPDSAPDDPERTNLDRINPAAVYPGRDPLASAPFNSTYPPGFRDGIAGGQCQESVLAPDNMSVVRCQAPTDDCCEDREHRLTMPSMVCTTPAGANCDDRTKRIVFDPPDGITVEEVGQMRAWVCFACVASGAVEPAAWAGSGRRVWGYDFSADMDAADTPMRGVWDDAAQTMAYAGGFMGATPLQGSGCGCLTKLADRVLCQGHRLGRAEDLLKQARLMGEWTTAVWGRPVCPLCQQRVGVDAYKFQGERGGEGQKRAFGCLVCHAFVVLPAGVNPDQSFVRIEEVQAALIHR